jgi:hypothetical protein
MVNEPTEFIFSRDDVSTSSLDIAFGPDAEKRKKWLGE